MEKEIYALVGTLVGAIISGSIVLLIARMNNRQQLKIESQKNNYDNKKIELSVKRERLEDAHKILSLVSRENSITVSYITSVDGTSLQEYHERYLKNCEIMDKVRMTTDLYFPDLRSATEQIYSLMNAFWGHQQSLIQHFQQSNMTAMSSAQANVISVASQLDNSIIQVKDKMIEIARGLNTEPDAE